MATIPGYDYGRVGPGPINLEDLEKVKASVLFTDADAAALRSAGELLEPHVEQILEVWHGFLTTHPLLGAYFGTADGRLLEPYLARTLRRFGEWFRDSCRRPYDQAWLDYQNEIALRHTPTRKNMTDGVDALPHVPLRYLVGFIYPVTMSVRPYLATGGRSAEEVDAMFAAWFKSVTLQVALWTQAYAPELW